MAALGSFFKINYFTTKGLKCTSGLSLLLSNSSQPAHVWHRYHHIGSVYMPAVGCHGAANDTTKTWHVAAATQPSIIQHQLHPMSIHQCCSSNCRVHISARFSSTSASLSSSGSKSDKMSLQTLQEEKNKFTPPADLGTKVST